MRIAVLSDSHLPGALRTLDDLGKEPEQFFATADLILHSGDVTSPAILDWLEQFAPVLPGPAGDAGPVLKPRFSCPQKGLNRMSGPLLGAFFVAV